MQQSPFPLTTTRVANNPPVVTETGDAAGNNTTTATMSVGDQFRGTLSPIGDVDWVRINLVAGQTYRISLDGFGRNSLSDPVLTIFDSQFNLIDSNDDGGLGTNSLITFTAGYTGTYFIDVDSFDNLLAGGYALEVQQSILPSPNEVWTLDQIADQLTDGYWNSVDDTARAFDVSGSRTITVNFTQLGNNQEYIGYAQRALQLWSDATGITFTTTTSSNAGIYFTSDEAGAFSSSVTTSSGQTATITRSQVNVELNWADADYTFSTFVHEVGHALGLGHAGNYNGFANYATGRLYLNDSYQASIMSYFDQIDNTFIAQNASFAEPLTPMLADIIAIRNLYGATFTTRTGNDTYGFNSTLGVGFNAAALNGPSDYTMTIIDDGGTDTVDLSGSIFDNRIDLTPLAASNTAGLLGNLFFAPGTIIENIIGGSGNDTVIGNSANNTVTANAGNDSLNGMVGNDTLIGGAGNDTLDGGDGTDFAFYDVLLADITVVYNAANDSFTVSSASSGVDLLSWVEFLRLRDVQSVSLDSYRAPTISDGNDIWAGGANNDVVDGLAGNDSLSGLGGDDQITGGAGNDTLFGGDGNDTLIGSAGNDSLVGGLNIDTASYVGASAVVVNLEITTVQATGGAGNDILNGIENLIGSGFDDRLTGTSAANHIQGGAGNDVINGAGGNDTLLGGADNDLFILSVVADLGATEQIWGDTGTDTLRLITTVASTLTLTAGVNVERVEIGTGTAVAAVMGATTAINVDGAALQQAVTVVGNAGANGLTGGLGADSLDGGAGNDVLIGGLGNDTLNGNAGTDTASYATATENLVLSLAITGGQSAGSFGTDTFLGIENLITGAGNDSLTGNALANVLTGGAGADTLTGGAGNDIIAGGEGIDTASYFDSAAVRISLALSTAQATAGAGTDTLTGIENLIGSAGNDTLTGSTAANRIDGGAGNDVINGGAGADTLTGGEGNDLFIVSVAADMVMGDQIIGAGDELRFISTTASTLTLSSEISVARVVVGTGTAVAAVTTGTTAINIDGAAVTGNQTMIGNAGANRLTGGIGADSLQGGGGADTLMGGGGADTLIGGAGLDILTGGGGADVFVFNTTLGTSNRDTITDFIAADDTIHLARSAMSALTLGQLGETAFWNSGSADILSSSDRIVYNHTTGVLSYDSDGSGSRAAVQIAQMSPGLSLTYLDFWVF